MTPYQSATDKINILLELGKESCEQGDDAQVDILIERIINLLWNREDTYE